MKFRLYASASSNHTYKREEIYENDMTQEDWDDMSESAQDEYLDELACEFVWEDIGCDAQPI